MRTAEALTAAKSLQSPKPNPTSAVASAATAAPKQPKAATTTSADALKPDSAPPSQPKPASPQKRARTDPSQPTDAQPVPIRMATAAAPAAPKHPESSAESQQPDSAAPPSRPKSANPRKHPRTDTDHPATDTQPVNAPAASTNSPVVVRQSKRLRRGPVAAPDPPQPCAADPETLPDHPHHAQTQEPHNPPQPAPPPSIPSPTPAADVGIAAHASPDHQTPSPEGLAGVKVQHMPSLSHVNVPPLKSPAGPNPVGQTPKQSPPPADPHLPMGQPIDPTDGDDRHKDEAQEPSTSLPVQPGIGINGPEAEPTQGDAANAADQSPEAAPDSAAASLPAAEQPDTAGLRPQLASEDGDRAGPQPDGEAAEEDVDRLGSGSEAGVSGGEEDPDYAQEGPGQWERSAAEQGTQSKRRKRAGPGWWQGQGQGQGQGTGEDKQSVSLLCLACLLP